jgi:hypothetical protein
MRYSVLFFVVLLSGCKAGAVRGLSLSLGVPGKAYLGDYERGLWFDYDREDRLGGGIGLKFDIVAGQMIRPVPKFWRPGNNPWRGDDPWFVIRCPMIGPYISLAVGDLGTYLGFKTFAVENKHRSLDRYGRWMLENEFPDSTDERVYLQPSASLRRTRWK